MSRLADLLSEEKVDRLVAELVEIEAELIAGGATGRDRVKELHDQRLAHIRVRDELDAVLFPVTLIQSLGSPAELETVQRVVGRWRGSRILNAPGLRELLDGDTDDELAQIETVLDTLGKLTEAAGQRLTAAMAAAGLNGVSNRPRTLIRFAVDLLVEHFQLYQVDDATLSGLSTALTPSLGKLSTARGGKLYNALRNALYEIPSPEIERRRCAAEGEARTVA